MKQLLLLTALCATLVCQAAEPDAAAPLAEPANAASAVVKTMPSRCPNFPRFNFRKLPSGDVSVVVRFLIKPDGSVENVRVEGQRARDVKRVILDGLNGYRCLPGEADEESKLEFSYSTRQL